MTDIDLRRVVYHPLQDDPTTVLGWNKSTVDYALKHKSVVTSSIRGIAKNIGKILQSSDVEDMYMDFLDYLYRSDDYNVDKAISRSSREGVIVSFDGYFHRSLSYCIKRCLKEKIKYDIHIDPNPVLIDGEGNETEVINMIGDKTKNTEMEAQLLEKNVLLNMCKSYENLRYAFGADVYQVLFIRCETMLHNKEDKYIPILRILGVTKDDISTIQTMTYKDDFMVEMAKAINLISIEDAIDILRNYTYAADKLEQVVVGA